MHDLASFQWRGRVLWSAVTPRMKIPRVTSKFACGNTGGKYRATFKPFRSLEIIQLYRPPSGTMSLSLLRTIRTWSCDIILIYVLDLWGSTASPVKNKKLSSDPQIKRCHCRCASEYAMEVGRDSRGVHLPSLLRLKSMDSFRRIRPLRSLNTTLQREASF